MGFVVAYNNSMGFDQLCVGDQGFPSHTGMHFQREGAHSGVEGYDPTPCHASTTPGIIYLLSFCSLTPVCSAGAGVQCRLLA